MNPFIHIFNMHTNIFILLYLSEEMLKQAVNYVLKPYTINILCFIVFVFFLFLRNEFQTYFTNLFDLLNLWCFLLVFFSLTEPKDFKQLVNYCLRMGLGDYNYRIVIWNISWDLFHDHHCTFSIAIINIFILIIALSCVREAYP